MIQLNQHPLLMQTYELMLKVEELPAGSDQTALITSLGVWDKELGEYLQKHGLLSNA